MPIGSLVHGDDMNGERPVADRLLPEQHVSEASLQRREDHRPFFFPQLPQDFFELLLRLEQLGQRLILLVGSLAPFVFLQLFDGPVHLLLGLLNLFAARSLVGLLVVAVLILLLLRVLILRRVALLRRHLLRLTTLSLLRLSILGFAVFRLAL